MLSDDLFQAICDIPLFDVHCLLLAEEPVSPDIDQMIFYNQVQLALRTCGADEETIWPGAGFHGAGRPYEQLFHHWPQLSRTCSGWMLRLIFKDLYEFDEPLTAKSMEILQATYEAKVAQPGWGEQVLARAGIVRSISGRWRRNTVLQPHPMFSWSMEFFPSEGFAEYLAWPRRLELIRLKTGVDVRTVHDFDEAMDRFYQLPQYWPLMHAAALQMSSEADFTPTQDGQLAGILAQARSGQSLIPSDHRLLEARLYRAAVRAFSRYTDNVQFICGTQVMTPGPERGVAKVSVRFTASAAHLFDEHRGIRFNILNGYEADEQTWCTMCQAYPNVFLAGSWWGTVHPSIMHNQWARRLDMVGSPRLIGFSSDAYTAEWAYARAKLTQRVLANVLAEKIDRGFLNIDDALAMAREILYETPRQVYFPTEHF